jgi:hypothetical protein
VAGSSVALRLAVGGLAGVMLATAGLGLTYNTTPSPPLGVYRIRPLAAEPGPRRRRRLLPRGGASSHRLGPRLRPHAGAGAPGLRHSLRFRDGGDRQTGRRRPAFWAGPGEAQALARVVPPVLGTIAYNLNYTEECCELLWKLCRDQPLDALDPQHPLSVLHELAGYRPHKAIELQHAVVTAVKRWVAEPDAHQHLLSPLDVLVPVLAKTALSPGWEPIFVLPGPTARPAGARARHRGRGRPVGGHARRPSRRAETGLRAG